MRHIVPILIAGFVLAAPVFAQRGGGHGGGGGGHGGGGGGMRGGGGGAMRVGSGGFRGGSVSAGYRGGGFRGGGYRGGGYRGGFRGGFRTRYGFVPWYGFYGGYGYYDPFFWDDYSGYSAPYPYYSAPYPNAYPDSGYGSGAPGVMIVSNSPYGYPAGPPPEPPAPVVRDYPPAPAPQSQKYETPLFLIAFKDGTIRAVLAYWVDGSTLHYVSMDHEQKQALLSSVDRDLSERFNRERNVTFSLPRPISSQ
jgi:hypothetical protein